MNSKENKRKLPYEAPEIEVFDYALETGFAASIYDGRNIDEISHYTDEDGNNEKGGWY